MATASVTFTPVNGGTVLASELVANFTDLVNFLNASVVHRDGALAMTAALAMGAFKITGVGDPTLAQDAATKAYVDLRLALAGGTMTGAIAMGTNKITGMGDPTLAQDAATKTYADLMLPKTGGTMSGAIAMGTAKITGLGTPTAAADAATMAYADTKLADHGAYTAVTYLNSWVDFSAAVQGVSYMKDDDGLVTIRGSCKSGTSATAAIFTLPAGFRPALAQRFHVGADTAASIVDLVDVAADGTVAIVQDFGGATTRTNLNGISFHV